MTTTEADPLGLVGTTVADKYAIESVVGEGGFAIVYRATHALWKRPVAVKVFKALGEVAEDQRKKLLADFIQEGALLADLSERSTAIVQARDVGTTKTPAGDEVPYMVLEWLEGKPLDSMLEAERAANAPLRSLDTAVRMLDPVAEALALAHKKGIAHRDVKPANIFVLGGAHDGSSGVKLLDFGIAKVVQDAQKMGFGKTAGHITSFTPLYGAPEQFNRAFGATGPWTDVFAFALVVAEVASGREPMSGDTIVQLAYAASDEKVRPTPRTLGCATSEEIDRIFEKALAVDPKARYQTAGEFWSALKGAVLVDPKSSVATLRADTGPSGTSDTVVGTAATALMATPAASAPPSEPAPSPTAATALPPPTPVAPSKSKTPLVAGLAAVVLLVGGGAAFALRNGTSGASPPGGLGSASASASASSVAAPSASESGSTVAKKECPAGMVLIPGGEYFMGSDEKDALDFEKPPHKVKLSPYCIDITEETVEQYKECSDNGGCRRAFKDNSWNGLAEAQKKNYDPLCNANDLEGRAKHPINCVDWAQANEACTYRGARLPTEAEWEYAARGSDGRIYPWGDEPPGPLLLNACGKECVAWMKKHPDPNVTAALMYPDDDGHVHTAPVGSFPKGKSKWGLVDVVGNVWEWVADWYADYDKALASKVSIDPAGPPEGTERVIRGGGWNGSMPSWVRPSFRFKVAPAARSHGFGFRCAKTF